MGWQGGILRRGALVLLTLCLALFPVHGAYGQEKAEGQSRMGAAGLPLLEQSARQLPAPLASRKAPLLFSLGALLLLVAPSFRRPVGAKVQSFLGRKPRIYSFCKLQLEGG